MSDSRAILSVIILFTATVIFTAAIAAAWVSMFLGFLKLLGAN